MGEPWKRKEVIGDCTLYLGDCMEVMPTIGKMDAVLTDPPYGIGRDRGMGGGGLDGSKRYVRRPRRYQGQWDNARPQAETLCLMLAAAPLAIVWGGQFFANVLPAQGKWLFWDKCQTMPSYGDGELAWTNLSGNAVRKFTYNFCGPATEGGEKRSHPTQKPVALMNWCLGFLPDATTILDPFMGSGTTLVACAKLGRRGIGIELDPDYFEIACRRVEETYRQPDMFVNPPAPPAEQTSLDLDAAE